MMLFRKTLLVARECLFKFADDNILYLAIVLGDEIPITQFFVDLLEVVDGIPKNLNQTFRIF